MPAQASLSLDSPASPDHHLWRNGRLWWVAFTVHLPPWQKERVRRSLGTDDLAEARRRRDELLRRYPQERGCTLSLRCAPDTARTRDAPARRHPAAVGRQPRARSKFGPYAHDGWRGADHQPQMKTANA